MIAIDILSKPHPEKIAAVMTTMVNHPTRSVADLERACRAERRRAMANHWSNSLPYHVELLRQLTAARKEEAAKAGRAVAA